MIEVTMPDGSIVQFPEGTPDATINSVIRSMAVGKPDPMQAMRDRIAAAKAGTLEVSPESAARVASADQIAQDRMTLSGIPTWLKGVTKVVQGVPFVGEYTDEFTGMVDRATGGTGAAGDLQKAVQDAMAREYPNTSTALSIGGGIAGGAGLLGAAGKVAGVLPQFTSLAGKAATGLIGGAVGGGAEGFISGYGAGEGDNRLASAQDRGASGAVLGGLLGGVAPLAISGIKSAMQAYKGTDIRTIAKTFNVSPEAAKAFKAAIEADDFAAAEAALKQAGPDAMLADAGGGFTQMLDTSMQSGGAAARIGREAVDSRAITADANLTDALDTAMGSPVGVNTARSAIANATSGARSAAYDAAYSAPINYADPMGQRLLNMSSRIPGGVIEYANKLMRLNGEQSKQILADIADDGTVTFKRLPDVRQWDYIKRALDAEAAKGDGLGLMGGQTPMGRAYQSLAKEVRNTLGDLVPEYRAALNTAADAIGQSKGVEFGAKILQPGTTRETVADFLDGATQPEIEAIKQGMRSQIDEVLANVKSNLTNPNADINEAIRLWGNMSSRANREKLAMVLGQSEADRLIASLNEAGLQLSTRASVARNSATAARTAGQASVRQSAEPGAIGVLAQGRPIDAARRVVQVLTGNTAEARLAKEQGIYAEIAQILTQKRGQEAVDALRIVNKAMQGQPVSAADAARVAKQVTAGLALGGYQTGMQLQERPMRVTGPQ